MQQRIPRHGVRDGLLLPLRLRAVAGTLAPRALALVLLAPAPVPALDLDLGAVMRLLASLFAAVPAAAPRRYATVANVLWGVLRFGPRPLLPCEGPAKV